MPSVDYGFSNAAPGAPALASMAGTGAAPGAVALANTTPSNAAPGAVSLPATTPSNAAPGAVALAGTTPNNAAPGAVVLPGSTPTNAAAAPVGLTAAPLPLMPANFIPAFANLAGLQALTANAADAAAGRAVQGLIAGEFKTYQVRAGTDAEAAPGIVRPANFHATTNAVVFVHC